MNYDVEYTFSKLGPRAGIHLIIGIVCKNKKTTRRLLHVLIPGDNLKRKVSVVKELEELDIKKLR